MADDLNRVAESLDKITEPANVVGSNKVIEAKEEKELFEINSEKGKHKHTYNLTVVSIWALGLMGLLLLAIRMYHFLTPVDWQWLDVVQIQTLDKMLFSGTIGSILGKYSGSIFFKEK